MTAPPGFTPEQRDAVELIDRSLLVSAGAGAGKTTVLVERVVRCILAGVDVDRLLVVTFTDAAAEEMRERVARALAAARARSPKDRRLARQVALLPQAEISTLHAFCLRTIRRYFHRLELDPLVGVMAPGESALLQQEVLDQLLEARYRRMDAGLAALVERYGEGSDAAVRQAVLRMHRAAVTGPDPEAWLDAQLERWQGLAGRALDATPWAGPARSRVRRGLVAAATALKRAAELAQGMDGEVLREECARMADLAARLDGRPWAEISARVRAADTWATLRWPRAVDPELKDRVQRLRERAKREVRALSPLLRPEADLMAELEAIAPAVVALVELVRAFDAGLSRVKRERRVLDFSDMERAMLELLRDGGGDSPPRPSPVARELCSRFEAVMVDEYQDINELQDTIVELLVHGARGRVVPLFLVGDVKQSIYRFRQAEPALFLARRASLPPVRHPDGSLRPAGAARIELNANFRSRPVVIAAINQLFQRILTPEVAGMSYGEQDRLKPAFAYPPPPPGFAAGEVAAELHVLERARGGEDPPPPGDEDAWDPEKVELTVLEREARVVARRIRALVEPDTGPALGVFDSAAGAYRPARYGDVVILLRSVRAKAAVFVDALVQAGIPVTAHLRTGFFQRVEVEVAMALLALLDNPRQDIPLAAVLRFPLWGFSADDLARIRLSGGSGGFYDALRRVAQSPPSPEDDPELVRIRTRLGEFLDSLDRWRTLARRSPLSELVVRLYDETGLLAYAGGMPGGRQRRANLLALAERARQFDAFTRQGLTRFLEFVERVQEAGEDQGEASAEGEGQDAVRVMTVHHSKGLEFPVVIVADLGARFRPPAGDLLLDRELGLGPMCADSDLRVKYPSIAHHAVAERIRTMELAEEMRVLYVALTRARERLILVGSVRDLEETAANWRHWAGTDPLPHGVVAAAQCALDWIGPALATGLTGAAEPSTAAGPAWRVQLWTGELVETASPAVPVAPSTATPNRPGLDAVLERLRWTYPWRPLLGHFAKRAVTEIKGTLDPERARIPTLEDLSVLVPGAVRFAAGSGRGGAARGRAVHALLERLDLSGPLDEAGVRSQLRGLLADRRMTPEEASCLEDVGPVVRFLASPLGARLRRDPARVLREWTFTVLVDAGRVYPDLPPAVARDEHVVVQGTVDCLVEEEGGFLLIDFKTDALAKGSLASLVERYRTQVSIYREAVTAITGRPVPEAFLVFLAAGEAVAVP